MDIHETATPPCTSPAWSHICTFWFRFLTA
jgi:hypothetical protein